MLLGDAKATAHFSIGSGTKLAMEDAIALFDAFRKTGGTDVESDVADVSRRNGARKSRRRSIPPMCRWSGSSMSKRFWDMDPTRFAFGLMTRSRAITYDNLALRAPEFVREVDTLVAQETQARGFDVSAETPAVPMFQPLKLRGMTLPIASSSRRCANIPRMKDCRTIGISCITAAAPSAAPACSSPK